MGSVLKPIQTLKEFFTSRLLRSPWYPFGTKLLELPAQFLIGSPGTLHPPRGGWCRQPTPSTKIHKNDQKFMSVLD